MVSSDMGAVQPVAVTSRSQSNRPPPASSTARTPPRPCTRRMSSPRRASATCTTSTPARVRSSAAASPDGLAVSTTAREPGLTAYIVISLRTAVESMTPGRSLPAKT